MRGASKGKVLVALNSLALGGAEKFVAYWAEEMVRRGWEVLVTYLHPPHTLAGRLYRAGAVVVRIGGGRGRLLKAMLEMIWAIKRGRPDVVQTHLPRSGALARLAGRLVKAVVVSTLQSQRGNLSLKERLSEALTLGFADGVVAISRAVERSFLESPVFGPILRSKPRAVIPNAVELGEIERARPHNLRAERAAVGANEGELLLLDVASFKPAKGHEYLLRAMVEVRRAYPKARLLLVGDGPLRPRAEVLCRRLGLGDSVIFLGRREDVPRLLWLCDIFVFPSVGEGLGLAAIEAMAAGKPVVATMVGGIPEVVRDGVEGLLVPARNPEALAKAVLTLAKNPELRAKLGEAGRRRARERFSIEAVAGQYEEFYLELLDRRGRLPRS